MICRKKAKTCKLSETEAVVADDSHSSSTDKNHIKPESDATADENKTDLPVSQCQPMLLSQAGKFVPKFMAKKKMRDCVVKLAECSSMRAESNDCSVSEVGTESVQFDNSSVADTVQDTNSACTDSIPVTDTCEENEPLFLEPAVDNDTVDMVASKPDASDWEQVTSPNNGVAESTESDKRPGLLADTTLDIGDIGITERGNDADCERYTTGEEKESRMNADVSGEIQHNVNSSGADHRGVEDSSEPDNFLPPRPVNVSGTSETAEKMSPAETAVPVARVDCADPEVLEIACREDSQPPLLDTNEVIDDSKTADRAVLEAQVNAGDDASDDSKSNAVVKVCADVPAMHDDVKVQADPDAVPSDDDDGLETLTEMSDGGTEDTGSKTAEAASVGGEIRGCITENTADAAAASSAPAKDPPNSEIGDDNKAGTVSELAARNLVPGSAELASFDDFLDLTDSQLCQLDDVSIRYICNRAQSYKYYRWKNVFFFNFCRVFVFFILPTFFYFVFIFLCLTHVDLQDRA